VPVQKSKDVPVWEKPDPTKTEDHLSKKKKASAKARARAAGRFYPNLIDNMAVSKEKPASLKISGKLHRIYEEKNGDIVVNHAGSKKQNGKYDKINLSDVAGVKSVKSGVKATTNWHKENPHTDVKKFDSPAWTRSEGKNPTGGLNAKGRASAKAEGHNLKPPVKAGDNPRRASFLARMGGMPGPEHKPNGEPTRLLLSLQKWGASSKADAKSKAAAMSVGKSMVSPGVYRAASKLTAAERKSVKTGKHYAASQGAAAQARDTENKALRNHVSGPGRPFGVKKPSLIRRADIESGGYTKIKRNVYVKSSGKFQDEAIKHAEMLPKMRRPTIVMPTNKLPMNAGAAAANFGSKSSPRYILIPERGVSPILGPKRVMMHESAHSNTKRNFAGKVRLKLNSKGDIDSASKKSMKEEARADRYAAKNGGAPTNSYRTLAGSMPIQSRDYISHTYKLWSKDNPMADKAIKIGTSSGLVGTSAYGIKNQIKKFDNMAVSKGLPSSFKGKVVGSGWQNNLPKSFQSKAEAHAKGKSISRKISSDYYKRFDTKFARNDARRGEVLRMDIGSARRTSSAASNPDRIAAKSKGKFESSFAGKKAELYREERLSRVTKFDSPAWEEVSKVFPQRAILTQGTRKMRVMVHYEHSPTHWGIIHPTEGQRVAHKNSIRFIPNKKPKSPGPDLFGEPLRKSMEYSVSMNQSRFGGASAVGKSFELVEKEESWKNISHYQDKGAQGRSTRRNGKTVAGLGAAGVTTAYGLNISQGDAPFSVAMDHYNRTARVGKLKAIGRIARVNPVAALAGGSVALTGVGAGMYAAGSAKNRHSQAKIAELRRKRGSVKKAEPMYDAQGNPVPNRKPLMSGNAKLGAAGTAIGLAGGQRMISATTLPNRLQGQSDAIASKVKFNERLANDQIQRVQNASQIRNPLTRRKQVRMHQYYSDKAQSTLADSRAKQITADNALKAAPAKKLAHLKSGAGLVATGGVMGGLAVYNNAKDRKNKAQVK